MNTELTVSDEQAKLWNGPAGNTWVELQPLLDRLFEPLELLLVEEVARASGRRLLDVGCGTGSTTLAVARQLRAEGSCVGIDVSEPMIALARARAAKEGTPAEFICADAQTHTFEPTSFDTIVSRFGVMFFGDPVAAFTNLRRATRPDGALRLVAWRSPAENPFMTTAERAAGPLLPNVPARRPDGPGQFAFADAARVSQMLQASGWKDVALRPIDVPCTFAETDLQTYITRLGPVGMALREADEPLRAKVIAAVRAAFEPYVDGELVRFSAACWLISGRAPSV